MLLGTAEIRVVGTGGLLYAAPNLIFHYVVAHNYAPPEEFLHAVLRGPAPPDVDYFKLLDDLGLSWGATPVPQKGSKPFRFVKTPEGVVKVEVE